MTDDHQLREDLGYVRSALVRSTGADSPATMYFLWAAITFLGFAIIDFAPQQTGYYWMIAGPAGGVLSGFLGWRAARALGQESSGVGWGHALHWGGLMVAILLVIPLVAMGGVQAREIPRIILLMVALAYWTAGVHLDGKLRWVAIVVAAAYLLTVFQRGIPFLWTLTGAVVGASFVACGLITVARVRRA